MGDGIQRVQYDGRTRFIEELLPELDPAVRPDELSVIVDRLRVASDEEFATRLRDSVARAFAYGDGVCRILTDEGAEEFSSRFEADGIAFAQPTEHLFSFNNPLGACPRCEGLRQDHRHRRGSGHPRQEQDDLRRRHRLLARRDDAPVEGEAGGKRRQVRLPDPHALPRTDARTEAPAVDGQRILLRSGQLLRIHRQRTAQDSVPRDEGALHGQDALPRNAAAAACARKRSTCAWAAARSPIW